jgi:hypothetical protein
MPTDESLTSSTPESGPTLVESPVFTPREDQSEVGSNNSSDAFITPPGEIKDDQILINTDGFIEELNQQNLLTDAVDPVVPSLKRVDFNPTSPNINKEDPEVRKIMEEYSMRTVSR